MPTHAQDAAQQPWTAARVLRGLITALLVVTILAAPLWNVFTLSVFDDLGIRISRLTEWWLRTNLHPIFKPPYWGSMRGPWRSVAYACWLVAGGLAAARYGPSARDRVAVVSLAVVLFEVAGSTLAMAGLLFLDDSLGG